MWWEAVVFYAWVGVQSLQSITLAQITAVVIAYVAWQQWKTSRGKVKLDLFDRRFQAYQAMRDVLGKMFTVGVTSEEVVKFWFATANADFLFGPDIKKYRDELFKRGGNLVDANRNMKRALDMGAPQAEREAIAKAQQAEVEWARNQVDVIAGKFRKYLDVSKL